MLPQFLAVEDHRPYTHAPYDELPSRWRHLPVVCVVRNPWDWYVSQYHYAVQRQPPAPETRELSFTEATRRACEGDVDHHLAPLMKRDGIDLFSAYIRSIAGAVVDRPDFTALRFEQLVPELTRFLKKHSALPRELKLALRDEPPIRTSTHGPYRDYYDDDLAELVRTRARWMCKRFRYRFAG